MHSLARPGSRSSGPLEADVIILTTDEEGDSDVEVISVTRNNSTSGFGATSLPATEGFSIFSPVFHTDTRNASGDTINCLHTQRDSQSFSPPPISSLRCSQSRTQAGEPSVSKSITRTSSILSALDADMFSSQPFPSSPPFPPSSQALPSSSPSSRWSSPTRPSQKRKSPDGWSTDDEAPSQSKRPRASKKQVDTTKQKERLEEKARKQAEKERAKAEKERAKAEKERAKAQKDAEKERQKAEAALQKEHQKAESALQKERQKQSKEVNKLVIDKKATLKDSIVDVEASLFASADFKHVLIPLQNKLQPFGGSVEKFDSQLRISSLIRWRRKIRAVCDDATGLWTPVEEHVQVLDVGMIFMSEARLAVTDARLLKKMVNDMKMEFPEQVFLMVDRGKEKKKSKKVKEQEKEVTKKLERILASLQVATGCFVVCVEGPLDAANWIYDMTADLGIKDHKLQQRLHLPFCADTKIDSGKDLKDTFIKMLNQIPQVTPSAAEGIVNEKKTVHTLLSAYSRSQTAADREGLLQNIVVRHNTTGAASGRRLNQAASRKIHDVLWSDNPMLIVSSGGGVAE